MINQYFFEVPVDVVVSNWGPPDVAQIIYESVGSWTQGLEQNSQIMKSLKQTVDRQTDSHMHVHLDGGLSDREMSRLVIIKNKLTQSQRKQKRVEKIGILMIVCSIYSSLRTILH